MHHAVNFIGQADENTEFGDVLDLAFNGRIDGELFEERATVEIVVMPDALKVLTP